LQVIFGDAWEQVIRMAIKMQNAFSDSKYDETVSIKAIWHEDYSPDELQSDLSLGVSKDVILEKLGYSKDKIEEMKSSPEYRLELFTKFYNAYNIASINGISIENFAKIIGFSDDEVKQVSKIDNDIIPSTGL
jgi:hypothetical protein